MSKNSVGTFDGVEVFSIPRVPEIAVSKCGRVWRLAMEVRRNTNGGYVKKPGWAKQCLSHGYPVVGLRKKVVRVHRLMGFAFLGLQEGQEIDHINRDRADNRLENLRVVTRFENMHNLRGKGYSWDKVRRKWSAMMYCRGKNVNLGRFDTEEEARAAYVAAKRALGVVFPDSSQLRKSS